MAALANCYTNPLVQTWLKAQTIHHNSSFRSQLKACFVKDMALIRFFDVNSHRIVFLISEAFTYFKFTIAQMWVLLHERLALLLTSMTPVRVSVLLTIISPEWMLSKYLLNELKPSVVLEVNSFFEIQITFGKYNPPKLIGHPITHMSVRPTRNLSFVSSDNCFLRGTWLLF